mmetsp:Transcript_25081/g.72164  ORF Transcript_25081/g.72164 Transcript_25081/m.72164 type:complete len:129 (+) Transcript_25081:876-1262(+)
MTGVKRPHQEAMQADSPTQPYNSRPPPPQWGSPEAPHTSGNQGRFDSPAQYEEPSYPPSGSSSRPHSKPPRVAVSALASDGGSGFDPAQGPSKRRKVHDAPPAGAAEEEEERPLFTLDASPPAPRKKA